MNGEFEEAIQKAMKEFGITYKEALTDLLYFMLGNGDTEDFKDFINYFITNQDRMWAH